MRAGFSGIAAVLTLRTAWATHRAGWSADIHTPSELYSYWGDLGTVPEGKPLSKLALHHLLRPISAASTERVFSFLTELDAPSRRKMGRTLVAQILFLRGNHDTVLDLLKEEADKERDAVAAARDARRACDEAAAKARLARAVARAAVTASASCPKRAVRDDEDEDADDNASATDVIVDVDESINHDFEDIYDFS
jgi:hypothetical protein